MVDISPDDVCLVCGTKRDEHGDKHHVFSLTSDVPMPIPAGPEPKRQAPRHRDDPAPDQAGVEGPDLKLAFATLVEVLAEKKINFDGVNRPLLTTHDVIRIFSGKG
ncbi:hypothetical protein PBI_TRISCUIT_25 [Microbacterium phage Triscuit]|nr:hypothetical protein PBI_TRISCUIT_25 [Microbacterium phage Triscuit]